jgi:hypothetical protein
MGCLARQEAGVPDASSQWTDHGSLGEIRFGILAVRKGFITPKQLGEAVGFQMKTDLEEGLHRVLVEVLVDMGFMTPSRVEEVLRAT